MRENYSNYGCELVTTLNDIDQKQLEKIEAGDIYLRGNHWAIIATKPDNLSNITTLQFARDIDREENKLLGGGLCGYNLSEKLQEDSTNYIYILRANLEPLHAELSLQYFLSKIDAKYAELYPNGPAENVVGDCSVFFEHQNQE